MKHVIYSLALILSLSGAIAGEMNYQGRLTDANGNPLADGSYTIEFSLHDASENGIQVWGPFITDNLSGDGHAPHAALVNGRFNVILGPRDTQSRELDQQFSGGERYLQIKLSTSAMPILPRV